MKKEQFSDIINGIDDELIVNARSGRKSSKRSLTIKVGAIAACMCLLISAAVAIPLMTRGNASIISSYNLDLVDSCYSTPKPGEVLFFTEVTKAREKYEGRKVNFLLGFHIFKGGQDEISAEELKAEHERLAELGYKLYYVEDHWTYYGKGQKRYIPIVVGLFSEEELQNFKVNPEYGYSFFFEHNGDSSEIKIDEENAISNFDEILY